MWLLIYNNLEYFKLGAHSKNEGFTTKFDKTSFGYKTWPSLLLIKRQMTKTQENANKYRQREPKPRH